jgi:hypothetical protein
MMQSRKRFINNRWQKGQAIPIGIAAIMATSILMFAMFNTSQVTSEKMRIVNTADAAAYSGMVVHARTLNFLSYTNRAMVANQVAIGQMVTLASWGKYMGRTGNNLGTVLSAIPYVGAVLGRIAKTIGKVVDRGAKLITKFAVPLLNTFQNIISGSQQVTKIFAAAATPFIVHKVVRVNDSNYQVTPLLGNGMIFASAKPWIDNTTKYKNNYYQNRKAKVVLKSRDGFTTSQRGWGKMNIFNIYWLFAYFQRDADTRFISKGNKNSHRRDDIEWEWKAKDTFAVWFGGRYVTWKGIKKYEAEIPVGWGGSFISTTDRDFDKGRCFWFWCRNNWGFKNSRTEKLANTDISKGPLSKNYSGIQPYIDITNAHRRRCRERYTERDEPGKRCYDPTTITSLGIEVRRKLRSPVRTTSNIKDLGSAKAYAAGSSRGGIGRGMLRVDDKYAGNQGLSATSRAEVYFSRPIGVGRGRKFGSNQRADRHEEYGNLFNPYWDVRLVDPLNERRMTWASRKLSYDAINRLSGL